MYLFLVVCCARMHAVLDLGLWRISAQETRGPCGPLMGMELTIEECCRAHTVSAFLSDAPHATHTHEKLQTFTALAKKEKKKAVKKSTNKNAVVGVFFVVFTCACVHDKARVHEGNANKTAASVMTVCAAVTCGFPGGPWGPSEGPGVLGLSFLLRSRRAHAGDD